MKTVKTVPYYVRFMNTERKLYIGPYCRQLWHLSVTANPKLKNTTKEELCKFVALINTDVKCHYIEQGCTLMC